VADKQHRFVEEVGTCAEQMVLGDERGDV